MQLHIKRENKILLLNRLKVLLCFEEIDGSFVIALIVKPLDFSSRKFTFSHFDLLAFTGMTAFSTHYYCDIMLLYFLQLKYSLILKGRRFQREDNFEGKTISKGRQLRRDDNLEENAT